MADSPQFQEVHAPLPAADEITLGELVSHYWRLLRQYYWIILIAVVVCVAGAYFWTKHQPQIYQASSKIIFHQKRGSIMGRKMEQVQLIDPGGRWDFEMFWNTQKEVLQSRWFAERVVKREGLIERKGFLTPPADGKPRTDKEKMKAAVERVLKVSDVRLQRDSRVGIVTVKTKDPQLSADIANATTEEYVSYTHEFQSGGLKQIVNWFDNYVSSKKQELEEAQLDLQKYKQKHNILSTSYEDRQNQSAQNMEAVGKQLNEVRGDLAREESLLEQIEQMQKKGEDLTAVSGLLQDRISNGAHESSVQAALQHRADLQEQLAKLKTRYLDSHPDVQEIKEQLDVVNKHIRSEIDRSISEVRNSVAALHKTEAKLEKQQATYKSQLLELSKLGVPYQQLKDRADNLQKLYETVLMRSSELNINSSYESKDIQVLEHADKPETPVSPVLPLNLAVGLLLGLGLGVGATVLIDSLDTTVKREDDIAQLTDKPILTTLPHLDGGVLRGLEVIGQSAADTITYTAPKSSYAEGIKTLRTNLTFMSPDNPPELMLVTSPGPSEGKTITSVNMAIAMAQSGLKTLLVDGDLRRPRIHKALGVDNKIGLSALVKGEAQLDAVTKETRIDGLYTVTCGDVPPNPSEMLHSEKFHEIADQMRDKYDRVIFDSPPLGAVSDALILSNLVDGMLLVIKFAKTRKEMLARSLDQLQGIGAPLMGVVLNEISRDAGGYYYGYKYYGRYSYYGEDVDQSSKLAS